MSAPYWRIPCLLVLLLVASRLDIKTGKVPNLLWLGSLPLSEFLLSESEGGAPHLHAIQAAAPVMAATLVALFLYRIGFFGGADMKAVISIAHVFPFPTCPILSCFSDPVWLPLSALINGSLASTFVLALTQEDRPARSERQAKIEFLPFLSFGFIMASVFGDPFTAISCLFYELVWN